MTGRSVVVAAPYPTMSGAEAVATFGLVRRMVAAGDVVTVISPWPSAAHRHADPIGPRGSVRLARHLRELRPEFLHLRLDADAVHVEVESRKLFAHRMALRTALQLAGESEVRLDRVLGPVSRQFANLVLGHADRVLVSGESERAAVVSAGVDPARVVVDPEPDVLAASLPVRRVDPSSLAPVPEHASAADLQALLRRRAAEDRAANRRPSSPVEEDSPASLPLRHLVRMERAQVRSNKPGGAFLKRFLAKSLAWQFDNVIASVNRLHEAAIESIDAVDRPPTDDATSESNDS